MRNIVTILSLAFVFLQSIGMTAGSKSGLPGDRERVIVLTDIENEPDDAMSLVRFLLYSNQWDVEGIVATTSVHQRNKLATWRIHEIINAYGEVQPNLLRHEPGFQTADSLNSIVFEGRADYGMRAVGEGMDSPGSDRIIEVVDREDDRPVWVLVWGGPNCLAQALYKVSKTRTPEETERFVKKLRVYTVSDQDDSGPWIRSTFPDLFYIASPGFAKLGGYHFATWSGISGDRFHGRFGGADFTKVSNEWLDENIRSKGPLGKQYPWVKYLMEGDTPTFLYLIHNGLGSPENPQYGSWGGRYEFYTPRFERWFLSPETRPLWTNAVDEVKGIDGAWYTGNHPTIWRWRDAYQNDFAARMDWTVKDYDSANHPPVVEMLMPPVINACVGDTITLAVAASDPDGDSVTCRWMYYPEAGSFAYEPGRAGERLAMSGGNETEMTFVVPKTLRPGTMHLIACVTDGGSPALTRYARYIVNVTDGLAAPRQRVLVTTDIGGSDPDDNQSMVHLLMYSDMFDLEGIVSSPGDGTGSKEEIMRMIDLYSRDYPQLRTAYPLLLSPDSLKSISYQGFRGKLPREGFTNPTEGSEAIVNAARKTDGRPLYVLAWGMLDDIAQALHDAPDIVPLIRVYWIGGPNKKWDVNAYHYIARNFPDLWFIENNSSYRGFINDEKRDGESPAVYFLNSISGHGEMGKNFGDYYDGNIKMGDTPSLLYMLHGDPSDPEGDSWGGQFEKMRYSPMTVATHPLTVADSVAPYSIIDLRFHGPVLKKKEIGKTKLRLIVDRQPWDGVYLGKGEYSVRYCPKAPATLSYRAESEIGELDGLSGEFIVTDLWPGNKTPDSMEVGGNWWTDRADTSLNEGKWQGAKTVRKHRRAVLDDWARRWNVIGR